MTRHDQTSAISDYLCRVDIGSTLPGNLMVVSVLPDSWLMLPFSFLLVCVSFFQNFSVEI